MIESEAFVTGVGILAPAGWATEIVWRAALPVVGLEQYIAAKGAESKERPSLSTGGLGNLLFNTLSRSITQVGPLPLADEGADRATCLAVAAADQAVARANLQPDDFARFGPDRSRVSIGTSKGGVIAFAEAFDAFCRWRQGGAVAEADGFRRLLGEIPPDVAARRVAQRLGITGAVHATVAACATGTLAIIQGARWIQAGQADIVLAGSSDASLAPLWLGAFKRMGVIARPHPTLGPAYACRPFDRTREGFVIGEGAAVLVLESARSATRRGVQPLARIAGLAAGSDPAGLTAITPDGAPLAEVMKLALRRGGYNPENLAAIMAHGTATLANDAAEAQAIHRILGRRACEVPTVSVKGFLGHLLGAAGAVETALSALAIRDRRLPGNRTLIEPDPALGNLNLPGQPVDLPPGPVLKLSLGFGGHLAAILLDRA